MKDIVKFELSVLIEKNKSTNERKLKKEIEKLLSQSAQLREVKLVQFENYLRIKMTLHKAFCLRVPQKWLRDSWVQGGLVFELCYKNQFENVFSGIIFSSTLH